MKNNGKLTFKIVGSISLVVIVLSFILCLIISNTVSNSVQQSLSNWLKNTAAMSSQMLDGDLYTTFTDESQMDSDEYLQEVTKLRKIQNSMNITYVYTFRMNGEKIEFVLDADDSEEQASIGEEYDYLEEEMEIAFNGTPSVGKEPYTDDFGTFLSAYAPILNSNGDVVGIVGADIDASEIGKMRVHFLVISIILMLVFSVLVILAIYIITKKIVKPVIVLTDKMIETAEVGGDLTKRINIKSNDEIGRLTEAFNQLMNTIHQLMIKTKNTTEYLASSSTELTCSMDDSLPRIELILKDFDEITNGISEIGKSYTILQSEIEVFSSNSEEIAANTNEINNFAQNIKDSTNTATKTIESSNDTVSSLISLTAKTNVRIKELGNFSKSIANIVDTISGIAEQTNLLALNAMIEAQRAGEAGRGFSVVAENIRQLSDNTKVSVEEIRNLVDNVINSIKEIILMQKNIEPMINKTQDSTQTVDSVLKDIMTRFSQIADMISQISVANESQAGGVQKILSTSDDIYRLFKNQMEIANKSSETVKEISLVFDEVKTSASSLNDLSGELQNQIDKFKV